MAAHSKHAKQIHAQTQRADEEQLICVHLGWLQAILLSAASVKMIEKKGSHALDRFEDDEDRDENEEDAVCETGQGFYASIAGEVDEQRRGLRKRSSPPIGKPLVGFPFRHDGCEQPNTNGHAIKCHMDR